MVKTQTNPSSKHGLGSLEYQVIAYKESRWHQFGADGLPIFGAPNGFGVMQLDNSPIPTARQIWDWTQNVDAGMAKFDSSKGTIKQHFKNIQLNHSGLRDLTADELRIASYQYYNAGNRGFYWVLNAAGNDWVKNSDTTFTNYGDDAVTIESQVKAGTPPPDWN